MVTGIAFETVLVISSVAPQESLEAVISDNEQDLSVKFSSPAESTRHASLKIPKLEDPSIDSSWRPIDATVESDWVQLNKEALYQRLRENGNQYGDSFQGVESIAFSNTHCVAQVDFPNLDNELLSGPGMPPVLLDVCAQALAVIVTDHKKTFVLEGIDKLRIHQELKNCFVVHGRIGNRDECKSSQGIADVDAVDDNGNVLFSLEGVKFRCLENTSVAGRSSRKNAHGKAKSTMAISATFTAEPLEKPLSFWADQFDIGLAAKFAPFNQTFQELLSPQSLLASNESGVNVTALRLEDWSHSVSEVVSRETPPAAIGEDTYRLPNQLDISHVNAYETEYLFKEIFTDRCYVRHGIDLDNAKCVIDIGANIGMFTMFIQQQCPKAKVFSFEPGPRVFASLKANCELLNDRAKAFNCGVSNETGEATFTYYEKSTVFSTFSANEEDDRAAIRAVIENRVSDDADSAELLQSDGRHQDVDQIVDEMVGERLEAKTMTCPLVTISDIIRENEIEVIDLLKVDAEKSELPILQGIEDQDWPKIRQIVIEVHDKVGDLIETVVKLLRDRGFVFEMSEEELLRDSGLFNIYATRSEKQNGADATGQQTSLTARDRQLIQDSANDFVAAAESFSQRSNLPHIVSICEPSPRLNDNAGDVAFLATVEADLISRLSQLNNVAVVPSKSITSLYPVEEYFDAVSDQAGKVPYTPDYYGGLATTIFRKYHSIQRQPYKVIVLDCDNTIWGGVVGEQGAAGIELDRPRLALQTFIKERMAEGMLVCLCSKNVEKDVFEVFSERSDMLLKREDIVASRINWQPKSDNLISLSEELRLGLDSFIMIDDNPVECAEIRANCPDVLTLELPVSDPQTIPRFLKHVWAFDQFKVSREGKSRTELYKDNSRRESLRSSSTTLSAFIEKLDLKVSVELVQPEQIQRVSELTQRTNQFNVSTVRRTASEIQSLVDEAYDCAVVKVSDRFGDYGLVGAAIFRTHGDALMVDTLLLSCRVLGRGVEHQIAAWLGKLAQDRGLANVEISYRQTEKNIPALQFLDSIASEGESLSNQEDTVCRVASSDLATLEFVAESVGQELPKKVSGRSEDTARTNGALNELMDRIANDLYSASRIHELSDVVGGVNERPSLNTLYLAPKTEKERQLANVWTNVLSMDRVGVRDNFFELGGTSLKAVQLISEIKREVGLQVPIVNLFAEPTIEALARFAEGDAESDSGDKGERVQQRGAARRGALKRRRKPR